MSADNKHLSMVASAIALRGVSLFLSAGRSAAAQHPPQPPLQPTNPKPRVKPTVFGSRPPQKVFDMLMKTTKFNNFSVLYRTWRVEAMPNRKLKEKHLDALYRTTHFSKNELEALYSMYRRLVTAALAAAPSTAIRHPQKIEGIDQNTFIDVMHNTFDLVTEEIILERVWITWDRGAVGGEGALKFEGWVRGLSVLLRGTNDERLAYCFNVYDLNSDGFITKDEMFIMLRNSLLKQPGDEDPDEGVRDLVELVLRKMDIDNDGKVSYDDYRQAVEQEPLLLEAFGQCLPTKRHAAVFLKNLVSKTIS